MKTSRLILIAVALLLASTVATAAPKRDRLNIDTATKGYFVLPFPLMMVLPAHFFGYDLR